MSAELRSGAQADLDGVLELSFDCPRLTFTIVGHIETTGREAANPDLAMQRAQAVVGYLRNAGLSEHRLAATAGDTADVVSSDTRGHNRRAEIRAQR